MTEIVERLGRLIEQKETRDKFAELNEELRQTNEQTGDLLTQANTMAIEAEIANIEWTQIFNTSADAMLVIWTDFKIKQINKRLRQLTNKKEKELTGQLCHDIFSRPLKCIREGTKVIKNTIRDCC